MPIGTVTIFGGAGFIGRHLTTALMARGARVRAAGRRPDAAKPARASKAEPQPELVRADLLDDAAVTAAVAGSVLVILSERGRQTYESIHIEGARRVAAAARHAGARRLVHFSALGSRTDAPARSDRTKAVGEEVVRAAFPEATIIRPSLVFGRDDHFFNRFASMTKLSPVIPLIGGGRTKFQPVDVDDVAEAIAVVAEDGPPGGKLYEFGGPAVYSFRELLEMLLQALDRRRILFPISFATAELQAAALELMPNPPFTRDQVRLLMTDKVVSGSEPTLADFGIVPRGVETVLPIMRDKYG